jgi:uncharacterized membrane protein
MNEPVQMHKKENRKLLLWFFIALLIAILPWFLLASSENPGKRDVVTESSKEVSTKKCHGTSWAMFTF